MRSAPVTKRMMAVGTEMVEMPNGPDDPRTAAVVEDLVRVLKDAADAGQGK
jgi:hypothetical protein